MHQYSTRGIRSGIARQVSLAVGNAFCDADQFGPLSLINKFSRIMQHENNVIRRCGAIARRPKVAREDSRFADPVIGEKAVRCLGIGPVLANKWNALPQITPHPLKQCAESLAKPYILECASGYLHINPTPGV
jgi:hypothetical protein